MTTRAVLAQPCIRCGSAGVFPCTECHQYWYCSKPCSLQHFAHGHAGQCKLLQERGKTSSTQIESTQEQYDESLKPLLRKPSRHLFEASRVQKLLLYRPKLVSDDAITSGLINAGNTCFTSAVLQCFANTQPLQVYLTSGEHSKESCRIKKGQGHMAGLKSDFCIICHLKDVMNLLLDPRYSAIMPRELLLNLKHVGEFILGEQEDAHQFFLDMLFKMHDAFVAADTIEKKLAAENTRVTVKKGPKVADADSKPSSDSTSIDYLDKQLVEETSLIYQLFGGKFLHKTRCTECGRVSMNPESFLILSLGLADGSSLEEALRNFCKIEVLPKSNESLFCDNCERRVTVQRQTTFWQAPEILLLHLKRFDNFGRKINKSIAFGLTLDFSDVINRDSPNFGDGSNATTYSLYAVIVHYGPFLGTGHYVAFVRLDGQWYLFDDAKVVGITDAIVMKQNAYMLLYKKNITQQRPNTSESTDLRKSAGNSSSLRSSQKGSSTASSSTTTTTTTTTTTLTSSSNVNPPENTVNSLDGGITKEISKLLIQRITPACKAFLAQEEDIMKDLTLQIHLPQLESLKTEELLISLTPNGKFELRSPVYYLLLELVFPVDPAAAQPTYFSKDRTLIVYLPLAADPVDNNEFVQLSCTKNDEQMSEDVYSFKEDEEFPVDPIVELQEELSEHETKFKKGLAKIDQLNMESATYKELYENIRELERNPARIAMGQMQVQQAAAAAAPAKQGAKVTAAKVGRNEDCPCGSGRKYKKCHGK